MVDATRTYLLALLDRAARTAIQTLVGYLTTTDITGHTDWRTATLATALAVVMSILQSLTDFPALPGGWISDVTGRALRTFAQTLTGLIGAAVLITNIAWPTILLTAALAALASVVTSSIATPLGPPLTHGTPNLTVPAGQVTYTGYSNQGAHLRAVTHTYTALTTAVLVFGGITGVGVMAARANRPSPIVQVVTQPAPATPAVVAPPVTAPASPDRAPGYLTALHQNGIPTTVPAPLLLVANSVCTQHPGMSDEAMTDQIVAAFPGRWTHAQAALIVDAAIDHYCT